MPIFKLLEYEALHFIYFIVLSPLLGLNALMCPLAKGVIFI